MRDEFKGPKGKDLSVFVRFGGLDLKKQDFYSNDPKSFHSPPAPRGIYAMPKVAQEMFLISSLDEFQPGIIPKMNSPESSGKTSFGWTKDEEAYYKDYDKRKDKIYSQIRKEFRKTTGSIWHHFGEYCKTSEIESRHGSWVKTSIEAWQKAFNKRSLNDRYGSPEFGIKNINDTRGIEGMYSRDHYEVFFDEKVG